MENVVDPKKEKSLAQKPKNQLIYKLIDGRMFPMTLEGLDRAMDMLRKQNRSKLQPLQIH